MSFLSLQSDWFVVIRKPRDTTSRGRIIGRFDTETFARDVAEQTQSQFPEFSVWVIHPCTLLIEGVLVMKWMVR